MPLGLSSRRCLRIRRTTSARRGRRIRRTTRARRGRRIRRTTLTRRRQQSRARGGGSKAGGVNNGVAACQFDPSTAYKVVPDSSCETCGNFSPDMTTRSFNAQQPHWGPSAL